MIQSETQDAVVAMEQETQAVEAGSASALRTGEVFNEISGIAQRSAELAQTIASSAATQTASTDQVGRSIKDFTGGAVATQKATDAARLTVEDMAKLADGLTASVAQFKLARSGTRSAVPALRVRKDRDELRTGPSGPPRHLYNGSRRSARCALGGRESSRRHRAECPRAQDQYVWAHKVRGASGIYGFTGLSLLGELLESTLEQSTSIDPALWLKTVGARMVEAFQSQLDVIKQGGQEDPSVSAHWKKEVMTLLPASSDASSEDGSKELGTDYLVPTIDAEVLSYFAPEADEYLQTLEVLTNRLKENPGDADPSRRCTGPPIRSKAQRTPSGSRSSATLLIRLNPA